MHIGQELTYDTFWHFMNNEGKDVKWYIIAAGGNYSFSTPSLEKYLTIAEILDEDHEDNEAGYKRLYFANNEKHDGKFVEAGGFPMDEWPSAEYKIRVHNKYPLEFLIDWFDKDDGFRDIILLRDHEDKLKM